MPKIVIAKGDIVQCAVDAIVNAANETLLGGGGVDGAIHRAAGKELVAACRQIPEVSPGVRCPTGEARITPGFRLLARYVIHTVGPIHYRHPDPDRALADAHRACFALAKDHGVRTIAFPAISCGVYGFPPEEAAPIAIAAAREADDVDEVRFVLFGEAMWRIWHEAMSG
jgi:O-acetyl-ADP-ribose deacetylase